MRKISFTYWRDGKFYIGFLNHCFSRSRHTAQVFLI